MKGFTLVELSIVLVIIGLLIGGILVAQSMVSTAKVQNFIQTIQQYDVGVTNFRTKYNSIPGDSIPFGGDGDGRLEDHTGAGRYFTNEIANFWGNMQTAGFKYPKSLVSWDPDVFNGDPEYPNAPELSLDNKAAVVAAYSGMDSTGNGYLINTYNGRDMSGVGSDGLGYLSPSNQAPFKATNAFAIDKKIDDGIPDTGNVIGGIFSNFTNFCVPNIPPPKAYDVSNSQAACDMTVYMFSQTNAR